MLVFQIKKNKKSYKINYNLFLEILRVYSYASGFMVTLTEPVPSGIG